MIDENFNFVSVAGLYERNYDLNGWNLIGEDDN
jgi:hypothetical protein